MSSRAEWDDVDQTQMRVCWLSREKSKSGSLWTAACNVNTSLPYCGKLNTSLFT